MLRITQDATRIGISPAGLATFGLSGLEFLRPLITLQEPLTTQKHT